MATDSGPTVRLRRLGSELRRLRDAAGFTLDQVGAEMECSGARISRMENGQVKVHPRDVRDLLALYGVEDEKLRDSLITLARQARQKGWWQTYGNVLSDTHTDFVSLENSAASLRTYQTQLVPGLLQTPEYLRALAAADRRLADDEEETEKYIQARTVRQSVLSREEPLRLWAILGEAVLHQQVGGAEVMRAQLRHLHTAAGSGNVTLQVLPFSNGAHAGMMGPFVIFEFPDRADLDVVYLENLTSSLYLEDEAEIARYTEVFDHLRASALPTARSRKLIEQVAKEL